MEFRKHFELNSNENHIKICGIQVKTVFTEKVTAVHEMLGGKNRSKINGLSFY